MSITRDEIAVVANTVAQQAVMELLEIFGFKPGEQLGTDETEALVLALTLTVGNLEAYLKGCLTDDYARQNTRRVLENLAEKIGETFKTDLTRALSPGILPVDEATGASPDTDPTPNPKEASDGEPAR